MNINNLRQRAKKFNIKNWQTAKADNLVKEINILEEQANFKREFDGKREDIVTEAIETTKKAEAPYIEIKASEEEKEHLVKIGLKNEWLFSLANQYNFDKFVYAKKFKAFRCYLGNNHRDWITINDLGLLHERKELVRSLINPQFLPKKKQIIKLPWR